VGVVFNLLQESTGEQDGLGYAYAQVVGDGLGPVIGEIAHRTIKGSDPLWVGAWDLWDLVGVGGAWISGRWTSFV